MIKISYEIEEKLEKFMQNHKAKSSPFAKITKKEIVETALERFLENKDNWM